MNRLRFWMLVTAMGCFASGIVIGHVAPDLVAKVDAGGMEPDPDEYQIEMMATEFDLSPEQVRLLRMIFRARQEDEMLVFRNQELEQLPAGLRLQIKNARNKAEQRFLMILTAEQRARYDEMSYGNK